MIFNWANSAATVIYGFIMHENKKEKKRKKESGVSKMEQKKNPELVSQNMSKSMSGLDVHLRK